jgi:hypothetical protein
VLFNFEKPSFSPLQFCNFCFSRQITSDIHALGYRIANSNAKFPVESSIFSLFNTPQWPCQLDLTGAVKSKRPSSLIARMMGVFVKKLILDYLNTTEAVLARYTPDMNPPASGASPMVGTKRRSMYNLPGPAPI